MTRAHEPFPCPVCGADVPARAAACPGCGADERTGWAEQGDAADVLHEQGLDLPETSLDDERYARFVAEELGGEPPRPAAPRRGTLVAIALFVLAVAVLLALLTMPRR
ncbi:MAG: zinc ribbon domain-containing protein [Planctomycetes bacterium]|nr:zinc ribbon domain-containing protein [Planctomycetota bacterium]